MTSNRLSYLTQVLQTDLLQRPPNLLRLLTSVWCRCSMLIIFCTPYLIRSRLNNYQPPNMPMMVTYSLSRGWRLNSSHPYLPGLDAGLLTV